jgi:hypothetical protein
MTATVLTHYDIDDALENTFPASDPPAWTPGVARPSPKLVNDPKPPPTMNTLGMPAGVMGRK